MKSLLCWFGLLLPLWAGAAPFTPASDAEIVERLPYRLGGETRRQRQQLAQAPNNLPLALQAAREAIARARRFGDPREIGAAQALLGPWWALPAPPAEVRLLRAVVLQNQHAFDAAVADLDTLIRPGSDAPLDIQAQAELTRAAVLQVVGKFADAQAGCERLAGARFEPLGAAVRTTARACVAELQSLQGRTREAAAQLTRLASEDAAESPWLSLVRAELAERMGEHALAEAQFKIATRGAADVYSRAAYADWLLDRQRPADVLALLGRESEGADALLLRRAIALKQAKDPAAPAAAAALQARFDAARQRGNSLHAREEARFLLEVRGQPAAALKMAQVQWQEQHEPADAVLLWRSAQAASQPQAAEAVRAFMRETGFADARLTEGGK
jgi:hypothetical protein